MKHLPTVLAAVLAITPFSLISANDLAKPVDHSHHHAAQISGAEMALAEGVIKRVDAPGGKLLIAHGPLPNGMPAMTMVFKVKETRWLQHLTEGQKIRFALDNEMTITHLEGAP